MKRFFWFNIGILGILIILLPSFSPFTEIPYNSKRIFQVGFLFIVCVQTVFFTRFFDKLSYEWHLVNIKIKFVIYVILLFGMISAFISSYPVFAFLEIGIYVLLIIFILTVAFLFKSHQKLFIKTFGVILSLMIMLYFIRFSINYIYNFLYPSWPIWPNIQLVQIFYNGEPYYPEPFLGFSQPRFLNHIQTWTLPLLVLMIVKVPREYWAYRSLLIFFTSFWWMLVFASDARGTMLSSVFSLILVFLLFKNRIKDWIKGYLTTSAVGLVSYLFFFKLILPDGGMTILSRSGDSGRFKLWNYAFDLFRENPILGAGPMHYADISNGFNLAHPHNFYLQILSEWGTIVFILSTVLFIYVLSKWLRKCRRSILEREDLAIQGALTASMLAGLMHSFLSGLLHTPLSQIIAAVVFGCAIGFYQLKFTNFKKDKIEFNFSLSLINKAILFCIALFVLVGTINTYKNLSDSKKTYINNYDYSRFSPRYWDHGNIGLD